jgi:glycosyltransferase involved in cell wall biosynthesis
MEFVPHVAMNDNLIREKCFIDDVVSTMEEACDNILENTELVQKKINTSQAYVRSLDWKVISKSFIEHFKNTY